MAKMPLARKGTKVRLISARGAGFSACKDPRTNVDYADGAIVTLSADASDDSPGAIGIMEGPGPGAWRLYGTRGKDWEIVTGAARPKRKLNDTPKGTKIRILDLASASLRSVTNPNTGKPFAVGDVLTVLEDETDGAPLISEKPRMFCCGGEGVGWERVESPARLPEEILRPGLLVRLSVTIEGGVSYQTRTIVPETLEGGAARSEWETTKVVADKAEHDAAVALRAQIRNDLSGACCRSPAFGLLCPDSGEEDLAGRLAKAQASAREFNARSRTCSVRVACITGRIARDDVAAARAIRGEIKGLLDEIQRGIEAADPARIRAACNAARDVGAMLSSDASERVQRAIKDARKVARDMTARVKDAGERAADTLATVRLEALDGARLAFLDTDVPEGVPLDPERVAPRALDLDAPAETPAPEAKPKARALDDAPAGDAPSEDNPIAARELD